MTKLTTALALAGVIAMGPPALAADDTMLTGTAAFGDWTTDAPGVRRLITPDDMPAPFASQSVGNGPGQRARPRDAVPVVGDGFRVELFAEGLVGPRKLAIAPNGDVFVAESAAGRVTVISPDGRRRYVFADDLDSPYGIAFHPDGAEPDWVYVAEGYRVVRFPYQRGDRTARGAPEVVVPSLPVGGHWTRDIAFSADGATLYVAVGSQSNVARGMARWPLAAIRDHEAASATGAAWGEETDRAAVHAFTAEGAYRGLYATGIRNCSGLARQPATGAIWCVTNERDGLGDNLPPDYATTLGEGRFYGWPWYYIGDNEDPRHAGERPDLAGKITVPDVLLQPHSAPLGIAFYEGDAFPPDYRGDAFVTLHGSWNRDGRTGYKVVRLIMENGVPTGAYEDFMTGFVISDSQVWGRPVGVAAMADGALLVGEDGNGTLWRVTATNRN